MEDHISEDPRVVEIRERINRFSRQKRECDRGIEHVKDRIEGNRSIIHSKGYSDHQKNNARTALPLLRNSLTDRKKKKKILQRQLDEEFDALELARELAEESFEWTR